MNCLECRRTLLVEPRTRTAELATHLRRCPACARLASRQAVFEQDLNAALRLPVPENLTDRIRLEASLRQPRRWRRFGAAAAVTLLSASLALGGWEYHASQRLASAITQQMKAPPRPAQAQRIADPTLTRLAADLGRYLHRAHLGHIVSTEQRLVAGQPAAYLRIVNGDAYARIVMLPHAHLSLEHDIHAQGLPGKLIPTDDGVIAVFCPDRDMLTRVAHDLRHTRRWRG